MIGLKNKKRKYKKIGESNIKRKRGWNEIRNLDNNRKEYEKEEKKIVRYRGDNWLPSKDFPVVLRLLKMAKPKNGIE